MAGGAQTAVVQVGMAAAVPLECQRRRFATSPAQTVGAEVASGMAVVAAASEAVVAASRVAVSDASTARGAVRAVVVGSRAGVAPTACRYQ